MAYAEQVGAPTTMQTLLADSGQLVERLFKISSHLVDLNNKLHGSKPHDAVSNGTGTIEPAPTVRRNLDRAIAAVEKIENELQNIDARV